MNAALDPQNDTHSLAIVDYRELTQADERPECTINLEDDGDDDRSYWNYHVYEDGNANPVHTVRVQGMQREAAYLEAATWANDNGYKIASR